MKHALFSIAFFVFSLHASAQDVVSQIEKAYQQSAFALFNAVAQQEDDNVCFSPLSVQMALSMAQNGAAGSTLGQLQQALGTEGFSNEEIGQFNSRLTKTLTARPPFKPEAYKWFEGDPQDAYDKLYPQCELANSLWVRPDLPLYEDFVEALRSVYDAGVDKVDFDTWEGIEKINVWANDKTHGLIPTIYEEPLPGDMAAILANALYFKGSWTVPFDLRLTSKQPFMLDDETYVDVDMMFARETFNMALTPAFRAVTLAYGQSKDFSMTLFVPLEGMTLPPLTLEDWSVAMKGQPQPANLYVPRFQIEGKYDLKEVMKSLGVVDAFDERADFSKMSPLELYISRIFQLSKIMVDEDGTEAAAITVIEYEEKSFLDPDSYVDFKVDRPFYFTIQSRQANAILFAGRVTKLEGRQGVVTGVESVGSPQRAPRYYDLQGRPLQRAPRKGVYIEDGTKRVQP